MRLMAPSSILTFCRNTKTAAGRFALIQSDSELRENFVAIGLRSSKHQAQLSLECTIAGTTLGCGSPEIRALNIERWLAPVGVIQHVRCIDAELKCLVLP